MTTAVTARPRAFAVWFKDLVRWNPGSFVQSSWHWPKEYIKPLSAALKARQLEAKNDHAGFAALPMVTIRFDGEMEPRDSKAITAIKGKLFLAHTGDVVYSKIDVRNGAIGIVPESLPVVAVTSEFPVYEVRKEVALPTYIKLLFRTEFFRRTINSMISGASGRKRIQPSQLVDLEVPLPPLPVQQAIIDRWQHAQSEISAARDFALKIEQNAADVFIKGLGLSASGNLTSYKAFAVRWADLDRWGVDVNQPAKRLDVSTSCFPVRKLGELIADLENGWSPQCLSRPATNYEWGVLKVGAVSFGTFDQEQNKALPEKLRPMPRYEVKPGDLIISRANIARYVGACALVKKSRSKLMLCDKLFRVVWKRHSEILPEYLDEVMKIHHLRYQIENALTGTSPTMKNISKPSLLALRLPLPQLANQKALIEAITITRKHAADAREKAAEVSRSIKTEIEALILGIKGIDGLDQCDSKARYICSGFSATPP